MSSPSSDNENKFGHQVAAYILAGAMLLFLVWTLFVIAKRCPYRRRFSFNVRDGTQVDSGEQMRPSTWAVFVDQVERLEETTRKQRIEERKAYIGSTLNSKVFALTEKDRKVEASMNITCTDVEGEVSSLDFEQNLPGEQDVDDEFCEERSCAICLNHYKNGDDISWSQNRLCNHKFHRQCITEWLLANEACPCCRQVYLSTDDATSGSKFKSMDSYISMVCRLPHASATSTGSNLHDSSNRRTPRSIQWPVILSGIAPVNSNLSAQGSQEGDAGEPIQDESKQADEAP